MQHYYNNLIYIGHYFYTQEILFNVSIPPFKNTTFAHAKVEVLSYANSY